MLRLPFGRGPSEMHGDRGVESTLNVYLAELLRSQGLEASSERTRTVGGRRQQPDVIVERLDDCIALECEFYPAKTVESDAASRFGKSKAPSLWKGLPVRLVLTVVYPEVLKLVSDAKLKDELSQRNDLLFRLGREVNGRVIWEDALQGSVKDIADLLTSHWVRAGDDDRKIDEIVEKLDAALTGVAVALAKSSAIEKSDLQEISSEPERVVALIWANAMVFHQILANTAEHSRIPVPKEESTVAELLSQWEEILEINYWPIFFTASESLKRIPATVARIAIDLLRPVVREIAESGMASRHDWAGRVFHRLLENRKFLATNYTTIPSAILLSVLALGNNALRIDESDVKAWQRLRIVDPCCGTGTLLMAVLQEAVRLQRRAAGITFGAALDRLFQPMLEEVLFGYDVVPSAVHLTAATLAMADPRQVIRRTQLWIMPHEVERKSKGDIVCRLGSLDFLHSSKVGAGPSTLSLFSAAGLDEPTDRKIEARGEVKLPGHMPEADLVIMNPPYTRAGGPGKAGNTEWNPIFGSVLSKEDVDAMQKELRKRNAGGPASLYAGLGSSFVALADENVRDGGRIAFVLPNTVATGSSWESIRRLLCTKYKLDWVVTSHDPRTRSGSGDSSGRNFVSFSESTRIGEVLIVGTRSGQSKEKHLVRFVNLRSNIDHPTQAMAVGKALLSLSDESGTVDSRDIYTGSYFWGEVVYEPQASLQDGRRWTANAFIQSELHRVVQLLVKDHILKLPDCPELKIPITTIEKIATLGPYHLQIKGSGGAYDIVETEDQTRSGRPAIWHHSGRSVLSMRGRADARLRVKKGKEAEADRLWKERSRLHITEELRHAPQRVAAVCTDALMLGVRAWKSVSLLPIQGDKETDVINRERALAIWLNSTLGLLTRMPYANRPYLGRSGLPSEVLLHLPILDVSRLSAAALAAAEDIWNELANAELKGFADTPSDAVRRKLNKRLVIDILGGTEQIATALDTLASQLSAEPAVYVRA